MYRNIIIGLLLSGSIFSVVISEDVTSPKTSVPAGEAGPDATESHLTDYGAIEQLVTSSHPIIAGQGQREGRKRIVHPFSEPVIIVIIFGVMAGIISVILLFAYGIGKLSERSQGNMQPAFPQNADDPLSSVETGNPVLPQNNNE